MITDKYIARQKAQDQVKNLELQIADLQSATLDAEAAAEKIERQRRALEADLQVCSLSFLSLTFVLLPFLQVFPLTLCVGCAREAGRRAKGSREVPEAIG